MVEFGRLTPPSPSSALPPQDYLEAVPKYISGRTRYLRVRLAFHLYPQLIPYLCTGNGFGPSPRYYLGFNLAMGSSLGFGSNPNNLPDIMESRPLASSQDPPRCKGGVRLAAVATKNADADSLGISPSGFVSARSRPIRTCFRYGSGIAIP